MGTRQKMVFSLPSSSTLHFYTVSGDITWQIYKTIGDTMDEWIYSDEVGEDERVFEHEVNEHEDDVKIESKMVFGDW